MMKRCTICILLCVCLLFSQLSVCVAAENVATNDPSVTGGCHSVDAMVPLLGNGQLITNAQAVFLYELGSDTLMYAWNPDLLVEPASFAKIMTALIALEQGKLADAVTVKQSVLDSVPSDAVSSELKANEVITLQDLLYCMMVGSGNDAAAVIADHIAGSQDAFVEMMNARAQELGCTNTAFTNPHGIYDEQQRTTVRDIGKILVEASKNETFSEIFGTVYYDVPATNETPEGRELSAKNNYLMCQDEQSIYFDERVTGGRTGVANDGTRCLASTAEQNGMKLISIIVGSASSYKEGDYREYSAGGFTETTELLDAGFTGYYATQILYKDQVLTQQTVLNGSSNVSLGCADFVSTVLPEGVSLNQLSFRYVNSKNDLSAPIQKGDILCGVEVWYGGLCVAYTDLYALNAVSVSGSVVIARKAPANQWLKILLIVIIVVILLAVAFFVLKNRKRIRNEIRKMQRKRRWKNRRGGR